MRHSIYTEKDFAHMTGDEWDASQLVKSVVYGGLSICKTCGQAEGDLDDRDCGDPSKSPPR